MRYDLLREFCSFHHLDLRFNEPMSRHTSLKIGGPADVVLYPGEELLPQVASLLSQEQIPYAIIGKGTNVLVKDGGIEGAVIFTGQMQGLRIGDHCMAARGGEERGVFVQAGCPLQRMVRLSLEHGLTGIEGLVGIPGSVGGAVAGNAGSFGYEIKDPLHLITLLMPDGSVRTFRRTEIAFGYRSSAIPHGALIINAAFALKVDDPSAVRKRIGAFMREKKAKQPVWQRSAGCVYKNPGSLSAGKLIDEADCKGMRAGGIEVSRLHANFFINTGSGTAVDFLRLMDLVNERVNKRSGIVLEPEIRIIGRSDTQSP